MVGEIEALEAQRGGLQQKLDERAGRPSNRSSMQMTDKRERRRGAGQADRADQRAARGGQGTSLGPVSRQKLLQDLEARREGVSEGVKAVLRQREEKFPFIRGFVADVLRVDVEHAQVIEAALNGAIRRWSPNSASRCCRAHGLRRACWRVNMLVQGSASRVADPCPRSAHGLEARDTYDWNQHPHAIRLATDLVRFEPRRSQPIVDHLLGKTVIVDDLGVGPASCTRPARRAIRYVTHGGEVLEADGTLRAGPLTAAMGLLSRRSELDAIASQIADVDRAIDAAHATS